MLGVRTLSDSLGEKLGIYPPLGLRSPATGNDANFMVKHHAPRLYTMTMVTLSSSPRQGPSVSFSAHGAQSPSGRYVFAL
jgi:hypothetical protein